MSDPNRPAGDDPGGYDPGGYDPSGYDQGGPPPRPAPGDRPAPEPKNFFGALFDFSFSTFVTPMIVKAVYVLITIAIALGWVVFVVAGFLGEQPALGVLALLFGWIPALLYLAFARMTLEFYFSVVRMSQDINRRLPQA